MKYIAKICLVVILLMNCQLSIVNCQMKKPIPFGDMDQWVVREIKESGVIGGKTKLLYEVGPSDTIRGANPYTNIGGSPWATSNVLAKVSGVVKTNTSVFPEERNGGMCARLETRYESVKVLGMINIEVIAAGAVYLGEMIEPIKGTKNPFSMLNCGIPYTEKPSAISFDYKIKVAPQPNRIRSTGFVPKSDVEGKDEVVVILILQKRWEDEQGNLYAKRVGTMIQRYEQNTDWVNNATYPILYGDISGSPDFKPYMKIQDEERYTVNSKGKSVPITEIGWAEPGDEPTHLVLQFASSHGGAYIGSPGNTLWIDNVNLIY